MTDALRATILVPASELPGWFRPLLAGISGEGVDDIGRFRQPGGTVVRRSAVLILFGEGDDGPDVLLIQRAEDMRSHAGQPAFPGGAAEPADSGPIETALREASEETLLDPAGVTVVATLPEIWIPPSGFVVTPVIAWWREPSPVAVGDPSEVAAVHRVPLSEMLEPANRIKVSHPAGYIGAGFRARGMIVWGFTGLLLERLFSLAGWELPWEANAEIVPFDQLAQYQQYADARRWD